MYIIDTHCDTLMVLSAPENAPTPSITPQRLLEGGVGLQVCALFAGGAGPRGTGEDTPQAKAAAALAALPMLTGHGVRKVNSPFDADGSQPCVMLSIEGGEIIGDSIECLRDYRARGVRLFGLTWNNENLLAYPHCSGGEHGLKPFGWDVVRELGALGIAVDVSHLGEGGFWDLIFHADKPPMASHSCCRALHNNTRNLTDDQLRALIDRNGWVGINFYTEFLTGKIECTVETVVDHIQHIAELGGVEHVGFGSDFDGIDSAPKGLSNPAEYPNLIQALYARGFSQQEVEGIAGGNFLRYFAHIDSKP